MRKRPAIEADQISTGQCNACMTDIHEWAKNKEKEMNSKYLAIKGTVAEDPKKKPKKKKGNETYNSII